MSKVLSVRFSEQKEGLLSPVEEFQKRVCSLLREFFRVVFRDNRPALGKTTSTTPTGTLNYHSLNLTRTRGVILMRAPNLHKQRLNRHIVRNGNNFPHLGMLIQNRKLTRRINLGTKVNIRQTLTVSTLLPLMTIT